MAEWILTSSVLIILVLMVRGLFKNKMKAKPVYALWLIVLVRLLCPVNFGELSFNLLSLAEEGKVQVEERLELKQEETAKTQESFYGESVYFLPDSTVIAYSSVADVTECVQVETAEIPESVPEVKPEETVVTQAIAFPGISWQKVLPVLWFVGMVVMAVVIFGVNISFGTTLGLFRKELPTMAKKGRGKKNLSVYLADGISSSCLYGVVRPSIYLNKTGMGEQEKTYCVEHEYSHYLQGDMVWSLCRTICLILHWYNPLVWLAVALSRKDAELACDERTIERLGEEERYSYGHTLIDLAAGQSRAVQMFGMATLMASDKKEVVERVKAITTKKETKIITGLLAVVLIVCIGFFVFTGEAKGEQENNNNEVVQTTVTPVPTEAVAQEQVPAVTLAPAEVTKQEVKQQTVITATPTPMPTWIVTKDMMVLDPGKEGWTEKVRIYEERDTNGAYVERRFSYGDIRRVSDIGDAQWFLVGTVEDEFGWVLYGEHEGIDSQILSMLGISEGEFKENREEKAQEAKQALENNIVYQPLTFIDHVALEYKQDTGWLVDLNGDGVEEQLYINGNSVFIDEKMQLSYKVDRTVSFWLLDIDTTDGIYELLDESGSMYIYTGKELRGVKGIQRIYFENKQTEDEIILSVYKGTLHEFTRIDEHTIMFENCFFMEASFFVNAHYILDETHGLQLVPQVYDVVLEKPIIDVMWYHYDKNQGRNFKIYQDRDLNGDYVETHTLKGASLKKSDCVEWAYIEIENGLSGWLYFGRESEIFFTSPASEDFQPNHEKASLRLYEKKDENSSYTDISFDISMFKSSRVDTEERDWLYVVLNTGEEGWFHVERENESLITWYLRQIQD